MSINKKVRITIIRTSSLGDIILASSILDFLEKFKDSLSVCWISREPMLKVLARSYPFFEFVDFSKEVDVKSIKSLLRKSDIIIDLQRSNKLAFYLFYLKLLNIKVYKVDKKYLYRSFLIFRSKLNFFRSPQADGYDKAEFYQYELNKDIVKTALQKVFGADKVEKAYQESFTCLQMSEEHLLSIPLQLNPSKKYLAISVGASFETKKVPMDLYQKIFLQVKTIQKQVSSMEVVLLGDKNDIECSQVFERFLIENDISCHNFAGKLSLLQSVSLVGKCSLYFGPDSMLGHAAEAQKVPSYVVFGPTSEKFGFAPYLKDSRTFSSSIGCRPCSKHGKTPCRFNDLKCYFDLDVSFVANSICGYLDSIEKKV